MTTVKSRTAEHLGLLEVLTLIFSVYVLLVLFIEATVKLSSETVDCREPCFSLGGFLRERIIRECLIIDNRFDHFTDVRPK